MTILLTGGTGSIGRGVLAQLVRQGHDVTALARTPHAADAVTAAGATPVEGSLADAARWMRELGDIDAIIHIAASFGPDMAANDAAFVGAVIETAPSHARRLGDRLPVIYTGGCWLYGETGDQAAIEGSRFDPPAAFRHTILHRNWLYESPHLRASTIHPAGVWHDNGGAIGRILRAARAGRAPGLIGSGSARWPLVHADDLAALYVKVLEAGRHGQDYHGVAERGVAAGDIARHLASRFGAPEPVREPLEKVMTELGEWAECLTFDQTMEAPRSRDELGWSPARPGVLAAF